MDTVDDLEKIYSWIDAIPLSKTKRKISRDFSDGVLMAEVLKYFYPKLVELHNYSPANSKTMKINNWITLNKKVLSKLNMQLQSDDIEKLTTSVPGTIESLLFKLYDKVHQSEEEREASHNESMIIEPKVVPIHIIEQKNKELSEKDEAISVLTQKVGHLEAIVKLKEQRIKDLTMQLERFKKNST